MRGRPASITEAARVLQRSASDLSYLIDRGHLPAQRINDRWVLSLDHVEAYRFEEERWISFAAAADLTGLSISTMKTATKRGEIAQRRHNHARPSVSELSVLAYLLQHQRRHRIGAAVEFAIVDGPTWSPPPDLSGADPWLSTATAARVLGCNTSWVRQQALRERIPATRHGARWWLRRSHVEMAAAARVARKTRFQISV